MSALSFDFMMSFYFAVDYLPKIDKIYLVKADSLKLPSFDRLGSLKKGKLLLVLYKATHIIN